MHIGIWNLCLQMQRAFAQCKRRRTALRVHALHSASACTYGRLIGLVTLRDPALSPRSVSASSPASFGLAPARPLPYIDATCLGLAHGGGLLHVPTLSP